MGIVSIPELVLEDIGTGYKIKKAINDGQVYDFRFYMHVKPSDSINGSATSFGPFDIFSTVDCTSTDVIPNTAYPDI